MMKKIRVSVHHISIDTPTFAGILFSAPEVVG